jgi:hypothetical protein
MLMGALKDRICALPARFAEAFAKPAWALNDLFMMFYDTFLRSMRHFVRINVTSMM